MSGETERPEWAWARPYEDRYERVTVSSLTESVYTISGKPRVELSCNLHKKPSRGCFPAFWGDFWPCGFEPPG